MLGIEALLIIGFVVGSLVGMVMPSHKVGCFALLPVPIIMIAYISQWQNQHPENLRSTSALDFMFGPLWPSAGAIAGFYFGRFVRARYFGL
ncbi:hypothetical protein [Sphingopyxis sp.]|jgi:hypothetical protein|uniref:hypothetical protein n=1 Tax=Sphingopyxis sp. TaxID=1908224 RepID=UPI00258D71F8|nr:hypothetical protein [Sphingopyxis sp.]